MSLFDDVRVSDLPSKIEYNSILNAIIEVRFTSDRPAELIVWPLYEALKEKFNIPQITPYGQVPREVRASNPDFAGQILYTIPSKDFTYTIGIGDGIFRMELGNFKYNTWKEFIEGFDHIHNIIQQNITGITRVGVRYVNIFNTPASDVENFTFDFKVKNKSLLDYAMQSVFEFPIDERKARVSVVNRVKYKYFDDDGNSQSGGDDALAIDIDVVYNKNIDKNNIIDIINYSHLSVKKIFFGMCTEKFKNQVLKPQKENI